MKYLCLLFFVFLKGYCSNYDEKIKISFNKSSYQPLDTIRYEINISSSNAILKSKFANIYVVAQDKIIQKQHILLKNGLGGAFLILSRYEEIKLIVSTNFIENCTPKEITAISINSHLKIIENIYFPNFIFENIFPDSLFLESPCIKGIVQESKNAKLVENAKIVYSYFNTKNNQVFGQILTNNNGEFEILNQKLFDTASFFMQVHHKKHKNMQIKIKDELNSNISDFIKLNSINENTVFQKSNLTTEGSYLEQNKYLTIEEKSAIDLDEILVKGKRNFEKVNAYTKDLETSFDGPNIAFQNKKTFENDVENANSLLDILKVKLPEIFIQNDVIGNINCLAVSGGPAGFKAIKVYLNKQYVVDSAPLAAYPADNIAYLTFYSSSHDYFPVLIVLTRDFIKDYDYSKIKIRNGLIVKGLGFSVQK
jgi:hypothetical protein